MNEIFTKLAAPFSPDDLEWRAGSTNSDKTKALALAYITSRAVMDRLDHVVGPENWRDDFKPGPDGGLICGISLRIDADWITKWDGAGNTLFEEVKGGLSSAFKRAAVKWGIGRYLYKLPNVWVPCEVHGRTVVLKNVPPVPDWALPASDAGNSQLDGTEQQPEIAQVHTEKVNSAADITGGNGKKRSTSWSAAVVEAILQADLAQDAAGAVRLLNTSDLSRDTTPEEAVAWALTET